MKLAPAFRGTFLAATLLSCAAPEHVPPETMEALPPLPVEDSSIDTGYWLHRYLGLIPHVNATALLDADLPSDVGFVVAFNRGSPPEDFGAGAADETWNVAVKV